MKLIIILVLSISQSFAIDVVPIRKDAPAPKDGFFIDKENLQEMRKLNEERILVKKENVKLKDLGVINEDKVSVYKKRAEETEKALVREHTKGNWKSIGGFILGAAATSLAAYAAIRATK